MQLRETQFDSVFVYLIAHLKVTNYDVVLSSSSCVNTEISLKAFVLKKKISKNFVFCQSNCI